MPAVLLISSSIGAQASGEERLKGLSLGLSYPCEELEPRDLTGDEGLTVGLRSG